MNLNGWQDVISIRDDTSHPAQLRYESSVVYSPRPGTGRIWRCNRLNRSHFKRRLLCWRLRREWYQGYRHSGYDQNDLTAEVSHILLDAVRVLCVQSGSELLSQERKNRLLDLFGNRLELLQS
jgi:hypothetical protein